MITTTSGKTFRLKVEVMPTFRWCQNCNTLLYHTAVLEQESRTFFEKHVPGYPFILTKHFSVFFMRSQLIDPQGTLHLTGIRHKTTCSYLSMIKNELLYTTYNVNAFGIIWEHTSICSVSFVLREAVWGYVRNMSAHKILFRVAMKCLYIRPCVPVNVCL